MTRYSTVDTQQATRKGLPFVAQRRRGLTLIELIAAIGIASIVMLAAAMLVSSGFKGWNQIYNNANCETRLGAMDTMIALGAIGRKSNKMDYCVYEVTGNTFERVGIDPPSNPDDILTGQAVEFRYWDTELDAGLMNPDVNATAYALFYLDTGTHQLKVDHGPYDPAGGEPGGVIGSHRNPGADVTTTTLAKNVFSVEFSHTAKNITGDGQGCVRMKLVITDPTDGSPKTTIAATLMRNTWPQ
jgi:prepilin-type N-terminal cleavage/methylation domain-containing protein